MNDLKLVDPQLLPLLDMFRLPVLTDATIQAVRDAFAPQEADTSALATAYVERHATGTAGAPDVGLLVLGMDGAGAGRPGILHLHGGGYVLGSPMSDLADAAFLADTAGAVVVTPDYRLAPESPFPAALHDCYAALAWMHENAEDLGISRDRIVVSGTSAGAGLAASLALLARDRGEYGIAFQLLGQPMLDDRTSMVATDPALSRHVLWREDHNHYGWTSYLGGYSPVADGYAAAARAANLVALPPACISVGALDLFVRENLEYAWRLISADVPTEVHLYPGAMHGFDLIPATEVGARYRSDRVDALRRALGLRP